MAIYTKPSDSSTARLTEAPIYGSSRIGVARLGSLYSSSTSHTAPTLGTVLPRITGARSYELTDHLGNVRATISDIAVKHGTEWDAELVTRTDYYPFGMIMDGRNEASGEHRYGYNGKENDNEVKGDGNSIDYGARILDPRVARWMSVDQLASAYPTQSAYCFVANTPLQAVDPDGRLIIFINGFHTGTAGREYWQRSRVVKSYTTYGWGIGTVRDDKTITERWDDNLMHRWNDYNAKYYDGSLGGALNTAITTAMNPQYIATSNLNPAVRGLAGLLQSRIDAADIFSKLEKDPNDPKKITETIKIIAHSMGVAYARGFVYGLAEYATKHGLDVSFEIEVDIASFQGSALPALTDIVDASFSMSGDEDWVANGKGSFNLLRLLSPSSVVPKAKEIPTKKGTGHGIWDYDVDEVAESKKP